MKQENVKNKKENREELVSYIRMGRELSGRQQILLVIQLSLPAIMAQLTSVAMQYIDASMVGRLGSGAAAAIGLVASTTWLFGGVCNSFSVGFAVQAAQLIGANKLEAARDVLKQALFTISCISVFLAAIGIAISSFLPGWLGGEKAILKDAGHYFLIYVDQALNGRPFFYSWAEYAWLMGFLVLPFLIGKNLKNALLYFKYIP
mgnify:CR=1 FL=1